MDERPVDGGREQEEDAVEEPCDSFSVDSLHALALVGYQFATSWLPVGYQLATSMQKRVRYKCLFYSTDYCIK